MFLTLSSFTFTQSFWRMESTLIMKPSVARNRSSAWICDFLAFLVNTDDRNCKHFSLAEDTNKLWSTLNISFYKIIKMKLLQSLAYHFVENSILFLKLGGCFHYFACGRRYHACKLALSNEQYIGHRQLKGYIKLNAKFNTLFCSKFCLFLKQWVRFWWFCLWKALKHLQTRRYQTSGI